MEEKNKEEAFPGIYIGDIVVSLANKPPHRKTGDLREVLNNRNSRRGILYYTSASHDFPYINSNEPSTFRKATKEETEWYRETYTEENPFLNIEDMRKISKLNNNYPIY